MHPRPLQPVARLRKVLPRGPVVRLAAPPSAKRPVAAAAGPVLGRDDWNAGRDLAAEERRSGLLLRLRDADGAARSRPLMGAVVKAQSSDYQVNEVDPYGSGAFLESTPKGRWRKISRQKSVLVENSHRPFSDPNKTYAPLVLSHGEYVRRLGKLPPNEPLLQFVMYRDAYSVESVLNRLRYEIGVEPDAVHLRADAGGLASHRSGSPASLSGARSPPGGSFGCITQCGCCVGVTREQLPHASRHYNLRPLLFDPRGYHPVDDLSVLAAAPWGHFYRLLLRCVDGSEAEILRDLKTLSQRGFINYFGMENFGVSESTAFEMAAMAAQGDYHAAIGCFFQSLSGSSPFHHDHFMAYVNAEPSTAAATAAAWATACRVAKCTPHIQRVVAGLADYHHSAEASADAQRDRLQALWELLGVERAARRSAGQFVWNAMATQRLLSDDGAARVIVGDVVCTTPSDATSSLPVNERYHVVASEEEARRYDITDVVLPVPDPEATSCLFPTCGQLTHSLFIEFAAKHKLSFLFPETAPHSSARRTPEYRHLVVKPLRLQAAVVRDPSSLASLKNDVFVRQERKPLEALTLNYAERVREPCVYNVSERFAERMAAVRKQNLGENSLALSFLLPMGASPLVALREPFALRYPNFTDLYFTS